MLLWLKERIEVPEAALYISIGRHLFKSHLSKDLAELSPHLNRKTLYNNLSIA